MVRPLGTPFFSALPRVFLGQVHAARGEFAVASAHFEEGLAIAREGDQYMTVRGAIDRLAEMDLLQGNAAVALQRFEGVLDLSAIDEADILLTGSLPTVAWAHLELGDLAEARSLARRGMERAVAEHAAVDLLAAERVFAAAAGRQCLCEEAEAHFKQALALARQIQYPYGQGLILYEWGRMLLAQGNRPQALGHLAGARDIFERLGALPYLRRTEALLSESGGADFLASAS